MSASRRVRSWHFYLSGAIGGLLGFVGAEAVRLLLSPGLSGDATGRLFWSACQFAAFGLAVGAALGITESVVLRRFWRAVYGFAIGALLGLLGGFVGGGVGQAIFGLLPSPTPPRPEGRDVAIVLDASSSMAGSKLLWFTVADGNDPDGLRIDAAGRLIDRLGTADRVAIVEFAESARSVLPLSELTATDAKNRAKRALGSVSSEGGTNLSAGLTLGLSELAKNLETDRRQYLILLTDGVGAYDPRVIGPAVEKGIQVFTIGLGNGVDSHLLSGIATPTGGRYFPVADAGELWPAFETIYQQAIVGDIGSSVTVGSGEQEKRELSFLLVLVRALAWGAVGLTIGFGQGVRENTREDLRACSLGGAFGGLVGGALFDTLIGMIGLDLLARLTADVVVGACIGGSMRLAQGYLVERGSERPTTLLTMLPNRGGALVAAREQGRSLTPAHRHGLGGLVLRMRDAVEADDKATSSVQPGANPAARAGVPPSQPATRKPLSFYEQRYSSDRARAMVEAHQAGYSALQIAAHFGVPLRRVEQVIERTGVAS